MVVRGGVVFHSCFIHVFIHLSIHSLIHSSTHPSTHSSIYPLVHPFTHPPIHPFTHPPTHQSTHPLSTHPPTTARTAVALPPHPHLPFLPQSSHLLQHPPQPHDRPWNHRTQVRSQLIFILPYSSNDFLFKLL